MWLKKEIATPDSYRDRNDTYMTYMLTLMLITHHKNQFTTLHNFRMCNA